MTVYIVQQTNQILSYVLQFGALAEIDVVPCDISVAGRILATFPEKLKPHQRSAQNLAYLGELCKEVCCTDALLSTDVL